MPRKGYSDLKGLRDIKGAGSLNMRAGQPRAGKRDALNFQLNIEKENLLHVLEQFESQKAKIEKRLSEIAQILPGELSGLEGLLGGENQAESRTAEKDDEQGKPVEKKVGLDLRLGKMSFGDLILGIGSFMDQVAKLEEEAKEEGGKLEGEISSPSGRVRAVYGFSIKEGLGGRPIVEPFGNVKKTPQGPVVEEEREPLVDIFDEEDHVSVIIELPGVQLNDIHTEIKGDVLTLSAANSSRKYYKEVVLPKKVNPSTASSKYKNGVFEITMKKM